MWKWSVVFALLAVLFSWAGTSFAFSSLATVILWVLAAATALVAVARPAKRRLEH
ncbi:hypothetical protein [Caldimonas brevitalea]|uniref:Uncharacterized protein n=1 Tax=Caldimonas brevitalea TaxID=413882 RepID=A0A0G3BKC0_9BURK|nr:hypothetical protein [Caldimonas brevitalea]AKJ29822.1 hypothetical protein AAW51_3131 [Caldimonas brevitalea]